MFQGKQQTVEALLAGEQYVGEMAREKAGKGRGSGREVLRREVRWVC